jgi:hypothetical protein
MPVRSIEARQPKMEGHEYDHNSLGAHGDFINIQKRKFFSRFYRQKHIP